MRLMHKNPILASYDRRSLSQGPRLDTNLNPSARSASMASKPAHTDLSDLAATQSGLFSRAQAATCGFSDSLLNRHVAAGRFLRIRRGVYRLRGNAPDPNEELIALWLATDASATFVDETALALHDLSDVLPAQIHVALPLPRRRVDLGTNVKITYRDIAADDRAWAANLPVTSVRRTLLDCAHAGVGSDLLRQATMQALARGLLDAEDVAALADDIERGRV